MNQEIHFVTGKGGVGKSVVAAGLALQKAEQGMRVLLVELGDQSFFKDFFDLSDVGFKPVPLREKLSVALWTGEACLREYATYLIKVDALAKLFFENAVMKAFINVAPGLPELAILGKITSGPRKHGPALPFDCIVVDAFATGHFLALLEAPKGMASVVKMGPMGEQSRGIERVLKNSKICRFHVVTLPEELPMKEADELLSRLKSEFDVDAELILNKVLETPLNLSDLEKVSKGSGDLAQFATYLKEQTERQDEIKKEAAQKSKTITQIPLYFEDKAWSLVENVKGRLR
jgi:anion-transporting  ArsA/GET3 family ATPase